MLFSNIVAEPFGGRVNSISLMIPLFGHGYPRYAVLGRTPDLRHALVGAALRIWASRSSMHSKATYAARWAAIPFTS